MEIGGWIAIVTAAGTVLTLAGSAIAYFMKLFLERADRRHAEFLKMVDYIDGKDPLAKKLAAIYLLRTFPEHRDFVIRFCDHISPNIIGGAAAQMQTELALTKAHMEKLGR